MEQEQFWTELSSSLIDKIIEKEYQLLEPLGHGAYGCLFLGQSTKENTYVAVKVVPKSNEQQLETDIQSSLKHPNILALHHLFQDNDFFYLVMELCDDGDLFDFVIQDQLDDNTIRDDTVVKKFFTQILDAIQYMHNKGVYHRDIKLENILLQCQDDSDPDNLVCKVADFGLATRERYSTEFGCGSPSYLAPEHFTNKHPYDTAAADIWSLGILLLALMFGRNPWQEATLSDATFNCFSRNPLMLKESLFPQLSTATFQLIKRALAIDAADRISISELKHQFEAIDHLYDDQDDITITPEDSISIPTNATKKQNIHSFDSAFFSGGAGMSWSDMVEEEEASIPTSFNSSPLSQSYDDDIELQQDDDDDMFIHSHEKESWWL